MIVTLFLACHRGEDAKPPAADVDLRDRAYVVSELSNELFVFDHKTLKAVGSVDTTAVPGTINANHMAMVTPDGAKVYVSASEAGMLVVVDAQTLAVTKRIPVGAHVTHMASRPDSAELWLMLEGDNAIAVVDTATDEVSRLIESDRFAIPHFARFSEGYAYVPNIGGDHVSVIDLATYEVTDALVGAGLTEGWCEGDPCGYADAQVGPDGTLFAAHFSTGDVLVYDTIRHERLPEVSTGASAWSAFVDPFATDDADFAVVPSWTGQTLHRVGPQGEVSAFSLGDSEVYGVNYSPTAPGLAFALSRTRHEVTVFDRDQGALVEAIDVGGTTETGTTTPDGRLLLPISSEGAVAVLDTETFEEIARFEAVGTYPWSVSTAEGQNYCH